MCLLLYYLPLYYGSIVVLLWLTPQSHSGQRLVSDPLATSGEKMCTDWVTLIFFSSCGCQAIANWPLGLCDWGLLHSSEILKKDAQIPSASPKSGGLQEGHTIWNLYWITYSIQACCGTPLENKGAASSTHIIYICHNYSVYLQSDLIQTLCCFFVFLGWVGFTLRLTSSFSCFRTTHCLRNWEWKWTLYSFCFLT